MSLATKTHICTESPCPIEDRELIEKLMNSLGTIYTKTSLKQFNEEVMKEFSIIFPNKKENNKEYTTCNCFLKFVLDDEGAWVGDRNEIKKFITQKLTEHKELILKVVRERAPKIKIIGEGTYCQTCRQHKAAGECDCIGFNKGVQEFLNNLDTI